jgi:hypothetical protein
MEIEEYRKDFSGTDAEILDRLANSAKCCFPVPLQEKKEGEDFPENPLIF